MLVFFLRIEERDGFEGVAVRIELRLDSFLRLLKECDSWRLTHVDAVFLCKKHDELLTKRSSRKMELRTEHQK